MIETKEVVVRLVHWDGSTKAKRELVTRFADALAFVASPTEDNPENIWCVVFADRAPGKPKAMFARLGEYVNLADEPSVMAEETVRERWPDLEL